MVRISGRSAEEISVGSSSWVDWLTDSATRSFSFRTRSGHFTARKESRIRGGEYWIAYRKRGGKLRKAYLGKAQDVTLARLEDAAIYLSGSKEEQNDSPVNAVGPTHAGDTTHPPGVDDDTRDGQGLVKEDPMLLTKLSMPTVRSALVARPRLTERLQAGNPARLTLISAPAGFGKTTLLVLGLEIYPCPTGV